MISKRVVDIFCNLTGLKGEQKTITPHIARVDISAQRAFHRGRETSIANAHVSQRIVSTELGVRRSGGLRSESMIW
jgi:hypothetical protein